MLARGVAIGLTVIALGVSHVRAEPRKAGAAWVPPTAPGSEVRSETMHYRFRLPEGWVHMDADLLAEQNEQARLMNRSSPTRYDDGYYLKDDRGTLRSYILVQHKAGRVGKSDIDAIEQSINGPEMRQAMEEIRRTMADKVSNLDVGTPSFDRQTGRFFMPMQAERPDGIVVRGISQGFVGTNGAVLLHCYARAGDFWKIKPTFDAIGNSLTFDQGATFQDALERAGGAGIFDWSEILKYGLIGGAVGLVGAIFKKKSALTA